MTSPVPHGEGNASHCEACRRIGDDLQTTPLSGVPELKYFSRVTVHFRKGVLFCGTKTALQSHARLGAHTPCLTDRLGLAHLRLYILRTFQDAICCITRWIDIQSFGNTQTTRVRSLARCIFTIKKNNMLHYSVNKLHAAITCASQNRMHL